MISSYILSDENFQAFFFFFTVFLFFCCCVPSRMHSLAMRRATRALQLSSPFHPLFPSVGLGRKRGLVMEPCASLVLSQRLIPGQTTCCQESFLGPLSSVPSFSHTFVPSRRLYSSKKSPPVSNGKYLNYSMLYHDSVAFLVSNQLGIPTFMAKNNFSGKTPSQVATEFNLSLRAASALLVTLCRMDVVQILQDSDQSVDDITYELTPSARQFLSNRETDACTSPFIDTFTTNFITPEALLGYFRPEEKKDLMSEHLEQSNEEVANNARHFMKHMNAQSYSCAKALPDVLGLKEATKMTTVLDIGGGSGIFQIEAAKSNPHVKSIIFELPAIKPITEEYIEEANLSNRISVHPGDFFKDKTFPGPADVVLFSNIFHDWPDDTNLQLIDKAFECLAPGGRIAICELLLADDVKSSTSSATSMNVIMLPYTKGRQYRPKELFLRLERAGFVEPHVAHLVDDYDLVVATKP